MSEHPFSSKPFTFEPSAEGIPHIQINPELLGNAGSISAREGYSAQEMQFLKYLASKGHTGGTA